MNALLLAAGKGTRLRPLTEHTPKCLVTVGGLPLMDIWLAGLWQAGFTRFLINTHHLSKIVEAYLARHPLHTSVETVFETELLGTAGTLAANKDFCMQGTTLIAHADNFCMCDWSQFLHAHAHRPAGTVMSMMTFRTPTPQSCGIVQLDSRRVVERFFEKPSFPPDNLANAAIYLIEPAVMELLLASNPPMTDISTELIPKLLGKINTWHNDETVIDIGTEASLQYANDVCRDLAYSFSGSIVS